MDFLPIWLSRVYSSKGCLLGRQGKEAKNLQISHFCCPWERTSTIITKRVRKVHFLTNQDHANIWGGTDFIVVRFYYILFVPNSIFLDFQIPGVKAVSWQISWPTGLRSHLDQTKLRYLALFQSLVQRVGIISWTLSCALFVFDFISLTPFQLLCLMSTVPILRFMQERPLLRRANYLQVCNSL